MLFEPEPSRRRLSGQLGWFGVWMGITAVAAILTPSASGHGTHTQLGLPPCPSALIMNRPCPGCGLTTSFTALMHGDLSAAFRAHAFGPALYLLFTATAFLCLYGWWSRKRFVTYSRPANLFLIGFTVLFVAFGLVRAVRTPNLGTMEDLKALHRATFRGP